MKKQLLITFLSCLFFMATVRAQDSIVLKFNYPQKIHAIIKFNPIPILWGPLYYTGEYRLLTEFTTSRHQSTQIGVGYLGKGAIFKLLEDSMGFAGQSVRVKGFRVQAQHKFYLARKRYSPQGFYLSPHVSYAYAKISQGKLTSTNQYYIGESNFNINLLVGVQLFIARTVAVDFFGGFGYKELKFWDQYPNMPRHYFNPFDGPSLMNSHLKVNLGLNFGIVTKKIKTPK